MKILAMKKDGYNPQLEYGIVKGSVEGRFLVVTDSYEIQAGVAISCLVKPEPGDTVLISTDQRGCSYILSVLERPESEGKTTVLAFEGQVELQVKKGGMSMTTEDTLSFSTPGLEINAHKGKVHIDSFDFMGRAIKTQIEKIKVIAEAVDSIVKRAVQRLKSSYRYVEEHDEVQSASTRMLVDGTMTIQTKHTMHIAEGHIKIDAEQIHLG